MKQIIQNFLAVSFSAVFMVAGLLSIMMPQVSAAQSTDDAKAAVCKGLGAASETTGSGCDDPVGSSTVDGTVKTVINLLSFIIAVIAIIMVIVGGLKYVTSQGESAGTSSAKNTIIYAIIGLIVVALAQILVRFAVNEVTTEVPATTP